MTASERIYLDNAATSWPKPDTVYEITWRFLTDLGGSAGRSVYREAIEAERVVQKTRQSVARSGQSDRFFHQRDRCTQRGDSRHA